MARLSDPLGPIRTSARRHHLGPSVFSIVPDGAVRRRPSDVVRVVLATVVILITALSATKGLTGLEKSIYDFFTSVPAAIEWIFQVGYWCLPVAVAAIVVGAIVGRHSRMVVSLVLAVGATTAIAYALDAIIGSNAAETLRLAGADITHGAPDYPPIALAAAAAAALVAAPYLTRPTRRIVHLLVIVAAISAVVLVEGLPAAVLGAVALAWGVGAAVQFALGTPAGTPATGEVQAALEDLGLPVTDLSLVDERTWAEARFTAEADGTSLAIVVLGRDAVDAGVFAKLVRMVWYKGSGPALILSRAQQVEHRAYLHLLAQRAGASVPDVLAAGTAGDLGHALLVTTHDQGRRLGQMSGDEIDDAVLDDVWQNLERLHAARLAQGNLYLDAVVVLDDGTTTFRDLSSAIASATQEQLSLDGAELLAGTAAVVGVERAVAAMARTLDSDQIEDILPLLQPSALSRQARRAIPKAKNVLTEVRAAAAAWIGVPEPELTELRRVSPTNLAMAAGAALGVYLLLGEFADVASVGDVFSDPNWGWVAATAVVSQTPQFAGAVAMLGSVAAPLPLGPSTAVQFANNFTGLVGGTVATTALVIRYFQKQGLAVAVAISSGVLNTLAAMVAQAALLIVGLVAYGNQFSFSRLGGSGDSSSKATVAIVVIVVVALVVGLAVFVPRLRKAVAAKLRPQFVAARDNLRELRGTPRKALQLFGGNVASQLLFAITLNCALQVYGTSLPLFELVVINSFASLLGGIAPVPGGMGVIEAGLIGGFTAVGVPETTAIAATFTARTFTAYLPPIWGWFSMQWLRHHDYL